MMGRKLSWLQPASGQLRGPPSGLATDARPRPAVTALTPATSVARPELTDSERPSDCRAKAMTSTAVVFQFTGTFGVWMLAEPRADLAGMRGLGVSRHFIP